jgi:hypothetical protein
MNTDEHGFERQLTKFAAKKTANGTTATRMGRIRHRKTPEPRPTAATLCWVTDFAAVSAVVPLFGEISQSCPSGPIAVYPCSSVFIRGEFLSRLRQ